MDFDYRLCKNLCKMYAPPSQKWGGLKPPAPSSATPLILTETMIMSIQYLLKNQTHRKIFGWQSTVLCQRKELFKSLPPKMPFIQVLHVNNNHWITVSNIRPNSDTVYPDSVCIYYSNWSAKSSLGHTTRQHICSFLKSKATKLHFDIINVDKQVNGSDCGVYALAFATELAHGSDPSNFIWDTSKMRSHIVSCILRKKWLCVSISKEKKKESRIWEENCT